MTEDMTMEFAAVLRKMGYRNVREESGMVFYEDDSGCRYYLQECEVA